MNIFPCWYVRSQTALCPLAGLAPEACQVPLISSIRRSHPPHSLSLPLSLSLPFSHLCRHFPSAPPSLHSSWFSGPSYLLFPCIALGPWASVSVLHSCAAFLLSFFLIFFFPCADHIFFKQASFTSPHLPTPLPSALPSLSPLPHMLLQPHSLSDYSRGSYYSHYPPR